MFEFAAVLIASLSVVMLILAHAIEAFRAE
jgi:hypothetical protein